MKHIGIVGRIALFLRTSTSKFTACVKAIIEADMGEQSKGRIYPKTYVANREIAYTEALSAIFYQRLRDYLRLLRMK